MFESYFSKFIQEGSCISFKRKNGQIIKGTIVSCSGALIRLVTESNEVIALREEDLTDIDGLSVVPAKKVEHSIKEAQLKEEGHIYDFDGRVGHVVSNDQIPCKYEFTIDDLFDNELYDIADSADYDSLIGKKVLFLREYDKKRKVFFTSCIMLPCSVDDAINSVIDFSRDGYIEEAQSILKIILNQIPEDKESLVILEAINEKCKGKVDLDLYAPLKEYTEEYICPKGRICELNANGGYILDVRSRQRMFFFSNYLLINDYDSEEDLLGEEVSYCVVKAKKEGQYNARGIIRPMLLEDAIERASNTTFGDRVFSWYILKNAQEQHPDNEEVQKVIRNFEQRFDIDTNLLKTVIPHKDPQAPQKLTIPAPKISFAFVKGAPHQEEVLNVQYANIEELPIWDCEFKAKEIEVKQEVYKNDIKKEIDITSNQNVQSPIDRQAKEHKDEPNSAKSPLGKTILSDFSHLREAMGIEKPNPRNGVPTIPSTHKIISIRGRRGTIDAGTGNSEDDYWFSINDIVDEQMLDEILDEFHVNREMRDVPIVCSISGNKAISISSPLSEESHILQISNLKNTAEELLQEGNYREAKHKIKLAQGIVDIILGNNPFEEKTLGIKPILREYFSKIETLEKENPQSILDKLENIDNSENATGFIEKTVTTNEINETVPGTVYDKFSDSRGLQYLDISWVEPTLSPYPNMPVIYSVIEGKYSNPIVWCMHRALPEDDMIRLADELFNKRHRKLEAWGVLRHVLEINPDNFHAQSEIERYELDPEVSSKMPKFIKYGSGDLYENSKQREAKVLSNSNLRQAIECYIQSISLYLESAKDIDDSTEQNTRIYYSQKNIDSCIKECINLYKRLINDEVDSRVELIKEFEDFTKEYFPLFRQNDLSNLETMYSYYQSYCDEFTKLRDILEKLIFVSQGKSQKQKRRKANYYAELSRLYLGQKSESSIDAKNWNNMALKADPDNTCTMAFVNRAIINSRDENKKKNDNLSTLPVGEDFGITYYPIVDDNITNNQISNVLQWNIVYYKLLDVSSLGGYNSQCYKIDNILRTYLASSKEQYEKINQVFNAKINYDIRFHVSLSNCIKKGITWPHWRDILDLVTICPTIAIRIANGLYDQSPRFAISLLRFWGTKILDNCDKFTFGKEFEYIRKTHATIYHNETGYLNSLLNSEFDLGNVKNWILEHVSDKERISESDLEQIRYIRSNVPIMIERYLCANTARSKEKAYQEIDKEINRRLLDIGVQPTLYSMSILRPLLTYIHGNITQVHSAICYKTPTPSISYLSISGVNDSNNCVLQLEISNTEKWAGAIKNIHVKVDSVDNTLFAHSEEGFEGELYGGETCIIPIRLCIDEKVSDGEYVEVPITLFYRLEKDDEEKVINSTIKCKISRSYLHVEFNPFAGYGQKAWDTNMFVGRSSLINDILKIVNNTPASQILVYGQKRCGKSSLLFHLRLALTGRQIIRNNDGLFVKTDYVEYNVPKYLVSNTSYLGIGTKKSENKTIQNQELDTQKITNDGILSDTDNAYYQILKGFEEELNTLRSAIRRMSKERYLKGMISSVDDAISVPKFVLPKRSDYGREKDLPYEKFNHYMKMLRTEIAETPEWENVRLVVMIDEFTSIHKAINDGLIDSNFMYLWKKLQEDEDTQFTSILIGQDVMPSLLEAYPNVYTKFNDKHIKYLDDEDAIILINKISPQNSSIRFVKEADRRVLFYTAGNPYYIWMFCYHLLNYANKHLITDITQYDIDAVASECVDTWKVNLFENLTLAGEDENVSRFRSDLVRNVLEQIALACQGTEDLCPRSRITLYDKQGDEDVALTDRILEDLDTLHRGVIRVIDGHYEIIVKLFSHWLCAHRHISK